MSSIEFNLLTFDVLVSPSRVTPDSVICKSETIAKHRAVAAFLLCSSMSATNSSILNHLLHKSGSTFEFFTFALGAKICSGETCPLKVALGCVLVVSPALLRNQS